VSQPVPTRGPRGPGSPNHLPDRPLTTTSLTLLERLRGGPTDADWRRLHDLYQPLLRYWIGRVPGLHNDQDDVCQEVFAAVVRHLPTFDRRREGAFRAWLRAITVNRIRESVRGRKNRPLAGLGADDTEHFLARLEDPHSDLAAEWDAEHHRQVLERLYAVVRGDFEPRTWDMFRAVVLDGRPVDAVASEFGVTAAAVVQAKSRALRRLRHEADGLLD
jgi:RNA polymerase sigma-70 factor (ECF subfamily)